MVRLNIIGLDGAVKKLNDIKDKELGSRLSNVLKDGAAEYVRLAQQDAPVDHSKLKTGISYKKITPYLYEVVSSSAYSAFMEFGTKGRYTPIAGVDASNFKAGGAKTGKGFYDSILEWVKRKKITGSYNVRTRRREGSKVNQNIEDEQTAFAIYLSIIRHGVKPHPYFFKQAPLVSKFLEPRIKALFND